MRPFSPLPEPHREPAALFVLVLGAYLILSPAHFLTTQDEELNLRTTLSLLEGRRGAVPPLPGGFASKTGIDGNEYAQYGLGLPVAAAPWCMLGLWIDPSDDASPNSLENVTPVDWAGTPFLRGWITVFNMMVSALTAALALALMRKLGLSGFAAPFFALFLAFGSYMTVHGRTLFTEPLAGLCLMGAFYAMARFREEGWRPKWALVAGACWAYAILTRVDTLATMPAAAWFLCVRQSGGTFRLEWPARAIAAFAAPPAAALAIVMLYNQYRFDAFFSTGYEDQAESIQFATPLLVGLHGFAFTPGRSLFLYTPILIFFPWGLVRWFRSDAWSAGGAAALCGFFLAAMSKWQNWAGGWDWGPRHIYQLTPFLLIAAAMFFKDRRLFDTRAKRLSWGALAVLSASIQLLGLSADPVRAAHELRESLTQPFPAETRPLAEQYAMQFMVYLPQFSHPALHWNLAVENGPDLLIVRAAQQWPSALPLYALPLAMAAWGAWRLAFPPGPKKPEPLR